MSAPDPNDPSTWGLSPELLALMNRDLAALDSAAVFDRVQGIEGVMKNGRQDAVPKLVAMLDDDAPVIGPEAAGEVRLLALAALQRLCWMAKKPLDLPPVLVRATWPLGEMRAAYASAVSGLPAAEYAALHARADDFMARRVKPSPHTEADARSYRVLQELGKVHYQRQAVDRESLLTPLQAELYARQVSSPPPPPRLRVALREPPHSVIGWIHFDGERRRWTSIFSEHPARPDAEVILLEAMPVQGGVIRRVVHDERGQPVLDAKGNLVIDGEIPLDTGAPVDILRSYAAFLGRRFATDLQLEPAAQAATASKPRTLADLSAAQIAEARAVLRESGRIGAVRHLCQLVDSCSRGDAADFVENVLERADDARDASVRDRIYVVRASARDLVSRPWSQLVSPLAGIEGQRWVRPRPRLSSWMSSPATGAPGVLVRSDPYARAAPTGTLTTIVSDDEIEPIEDVELAARRWIASQVASELRNRPLPATPRAIGSALGVSGPLTADGEIALTGLLLESSLPADDRPPGFRGPDAWYRTPPGENVLMVTPDEARARGLPPVAIMVDTSESGLIHGPKSRSGPFYLRLHGPPGDAIEFALWAAADDERGADGIERSLRRVLDLRRPELVKVQGGVHPVQLAGGQRQAGCVYFQLPSPMPRFVHCVVIVEHAGGAVMASFTHDVHRDQDVTPAQVLDHPRLRRLVRSLQVA